MNIYLVGFMGTGKTAVGKELSRKKKLQFVDLDELIELKEKRAISDIFAKSGEPYFRKVEKQVLKEVATQKKFVVACGGGIVLDKENIKVMKETGALICLTATPSVILKRTSGHIHRPLLNVRAPKKQIEHLLKLRAPYYAQADKTIDTSKISIKEAAGKIIKIISAKGKVNKRRLARAAVIFFLLIFFPFYSRAEDDPAAMFNDMVSKFRSLRSFSAEYEMMDYTNSQKSKLALFLQQPDKSREELHTPSYDSVLVFNGETEWSYYSHINIAMKSCRRKKPSLICGLMPSIPVEIPVKFYGSEVFGGEDCYILEQDYSQLVEAIPDKMKNSNILKKFKLRFWFKKDNGIPMKIQKYGEDGKLISEIQILPDTYFTDIPLPDQKFEFDPPYGTRIVDHCKEKAG